MNLDSIVMEMIAFDKGDAKRIQHFMKVHAFAALIGREEKLPSDVQETLEIAAILHDIGIHAAEEKYHSTAGVYQEKEGPLPAKHLLKKIGYSSPVIERVCYLIGHHHTYQNVDGMDHQILLESDFLVNAFEDKVSQNGILAFRQNVFRTKTGIHLLNQFYGLASA